MEGEDQSLSCLVSACLASRCSAVGKYHRLREVVCVAPEVMLSKRMGDPGKMLVVVESGDME